MTIMEMAPYIYGTEFTRECSNPVRCTPYMYDKVIDAASCSDDYEGLMKHIFDYRDFVEMAPDISRLFPVSEREEMFYCLKNGGYCEDVPAKCIYVLKEGYNKYDSATLALKATPAPLLKIFFQKNYFNNCTMRDVIKNFIDPDYEPLTPSNLRIKHEMYHEIYVASQDMVALVPPSISEKLSDRDLADITLGKDGLEIKGLLLRMMGGYYGACNSTYDLRLLV